MITAIEIGIAIRFRSAARRAGGERYARESRLHNLPEAAEKALSAPLLKRDKARVMTTWALLFSAAAVGAIS
jgi:hypothetical protein